MSDVQFNRERFEAVYSDIMQSRNLKSNLEEVEEAIGQVDKLIGLDKLPGVDTTRYEDLKNQLFYLKYEILERL